jgi:carboxylesterase type B
MVFVHGGGFANGSANHPHYDLAKITQLSVKTGTPIIAVGVK